MKYIKLTTVEENHPVKYIIIKRDDIELVKDYGSHRLVIIKTATGTDQWIVSETLDEIYLMLEGEEILPGLSKNKTPLYD